VPHFFHIGGVGYSLLTLYIGGENILFRKFDPLLVIKAIEERKITNALLVPAMLQAILHLPELGKFNFSSLRNIQHGGSPISEIILRKAKKIFQCYFTGAYGLTETSGIASLLRFDVQEKGLAECATREDIHRLSSVGKPSPEMDICIKKESGEKVKANELGEVCIKGEYVFSGYANSQGLEQNEFDEENWFHTGDIGLLDEEGYLFLFDRKNDMILSKSENIYPIEVERVLATHPDIVEVAVVGIPDNEYGEIVTAFLVLRPGTNIDYSEIRGFSKNSLASFKIPRQIFIVNEIPRNLSGKILRNELKDRFN
jgi:acyl-CoA synthetase (AMP-forming)/AMP-acid ligase II